MNIMRDINKLIIEKLKEIDFICFTEKQLFDINNMAVKGIKTKLNNNIKIFKIYCTFSSLLHHTHPCGLLLYNV